MIVRLAIAFGVYCQYGRPMQLPPDGDYAVAVARGTLKPDIGFIRAGAIAVAAACGRLRSWGPILRYRQAPRSQLEPDAEGKRLADRRDFRSTSWPWWFFSLIPIGWLLADFTDGTPLDSRRPSAAGTPSWSSG